MTIHHEKSLILREMLQVRYCFLGLGTTLVGKQLVNDAFAVQCVQFQQLTSELENIDTYASLLT